jgi:predicted AAA+ superfamily ATPase
MACVRQSLSEYFIFFNELQTTYYNEEEYAKSYRLFQEDMSESVKRGMLFFDEIQLAEIVRESAKVVFDGEFHKIDAFKKIKKPK